MDFKPNSCKMSRQWMMFAFALLCCLNVAAASGTDSNSSANKINATSSRTFPDSGEHRLPSYLEKYYAEPPNQHRYDNDGSLPYEVPSGFDQFVPDKSSGPKYGYGSVFLPYPFDVKPDRLEDEANQDTNLVPTPTRPSPIKDLISKVVKFFTGSSDEVDVRPTTFLSGLGNLFRDPMVLLTALIVPLGLLLSAVVPFITKNFVKTIMSPSVSSAIAGAVARGLESPEAEQVLKAVGEFGARALEDPRCLQRLLCQTAKAHIESRSGDFWSAQRIVQKLAKSVDDKVWNALGLKSFLGALQSGHCQNLQCGKGAGNSTRPFFEALRAILTKLFNVTEVVQ